MKHKKIITSILIFSIGFFHSVASETSCELPMSVNLDEVVIIPARETTSLRQQPVAFSLISAEKIEKLNINSLQELSSFVPNFTMLDYGSRTTSTIFVRGIGSRMNEPSVGLYVDDIPFLNKSAFDFTFYDINNIEFLRGPQGTLYGRNSLGGLVRINTLSPFNYQGTRLFVSYGSANEQIYRLSHYRKLNERLAISLAGYYHGHDGFFRNEFTGKKDEMESFGGRMRLEWRINPKWNMNFSAVYDNLWQLAYPYAPFDIETGTIGAINYDDEGSYRREMLTAGLSFQRRSENLVFTSATSFQYLDDTMKIDTDFSPIPIFSLTQNQNINTLTQEFVFRSRGHSDYQWVAGAFGFYKNSLIDAPITFRDNALTHLASGLPPFIVSQEAVFPGNFSIPVYGAALYHQSSYRFFDRLKLTAGIRFEYERTSMNYNTSANMTVIMPPMGMPPVPTPIRSNDTILGNLSQDFFAFLPKIALKYDFNDQHSIYASISRGFKTGGFNFQMFSDVLQQSLMSQTISQVRELIPPHIPINLPNFDTETEIDLDNMISYKPEFTINYEIGMRSEIIRNRLFADVAVFYIDHTNQQIVTFSSANIGSRRMENAGRSQSVGAEIAVRANITQDLNANISYGYTHATFREFHDGEYDFSGNFVPLVPRNTFSVGADYTLRTNLSFLDNIVFRVQYNGLGKMYFTERNEISQDFYGILNGNISFEKGNFTLNGWIKNALNSDFKTFYFTSLDNHFVQRGRPRQFGVSAQFNF